MEVDKRNNKRVIREEEETERVKKNKRLQSVEEEEEDDEENDVPAEEEVEEFFAILRRMRVAVKYFDDKGRGGREWREALETPEITENHRHHLVGAAQEDDKPNKKGGEVIISQGFDLNAAAPEVADGGGA